MASVNTIVTYYLGAYLQSLSDHIVDTVYTIDGTPILDKKNILPQIYSRDEDFPQVNTGEIVLAIQNSNRKVWTKSLPTTCYIDLVVCRKVDTNEVNVETDLLNDANEYYIHKLIEIDPTTQTSILPDATTESQQFVAAVADVISLESQGLKTEEIEGSESSVIMIRTRITMKIKNRSKSGGAYG